MALRPEVSLPTALATGAIVWAVYDGALPSHTDIRVGGQHDPHIAATERTAAWTAAAIVGAVSLISKDPNVFMLGAGMVITLSWWYRHSNAVNPETGSAATVSPVRTPDMYQSGPAS